MKEKRIRPRRHARLRTIFESGWISFYLNVDPFFQSHALTGHRIPAQGANPGNPPGKRNPRSEGTPHRSRVLGLDPALPMRHMNQRHPLLSPTGRQMGGCSIDLHCALSPSLNVKFLCYPVYSGRLSSNPRRMVSSGAGAPNQYSNEAAPWCSSMERPLAARAPTARAAASMAVSGGL